MSSDEKSITSCNIVNLKLNLDPTGINASQSTSTQRNNERRNSNSNTTNTHKEVLNAVLRLEGKIDDQARKIESLSKDAENRDKRMEEKIKDNSSAVSAKFESLLNQVAEQQRYDDLKEKYQHLKATQQSIREKLNTKDERIRELKLDEAGHKKKVEECQNTIAHLRAEITQKERLLEEKDKLLESKDKEKKLEQRRHSEEVQRIKMEVQSEQRKLKECEEKKQQLHDEMRQNERAIATLETENNQLKIQQQESEKRTNEFYQVLEKTVESVAEKSASKFTEIENDPDEEDKPGTPLRQRIKSESDAQSPTIKGAQVQTDSNSKSPGNIQRSYSSPSQGIAFVGTKSAALSKHKDHRPASSAKDLPKAIAKARKNLTEKTLTPRK